MDPFDLQFDLSQLAAQAERAETGGTGQASTFKSNVDSNGSDHSRLLHNQQKPDVDLQHEQPHHVTAAYMVAQGYNTKEISARLGNGFTPAAVRLWRKQPWFVKRVMDIIRDAGSDGVRELVTGTAPENVLTLIHLRDNAKSESVRAMAAIHLWDRYEGKVGEPHKQAQKADDPLAEKERLEVELRRLQAQLKTPTEPPNGTPGLSA